MICFSNFSEMEKGKKIKRSVMSEMIADYGDGGQKMLDIMKFN